MKTILSCLTLFTLFSLPLYAGSHECQDYTSQGLDMHAEHGLTSCGNVTAASIMADKPYGFAQNCTAEVTNINGVLLRSEWLVCSPAANTGGTPGCDYQFVTRCGGSTLTSGELLVGINGNGTFPACTHSAQTSTSPESFQCTYNSPNGDVGTEVCYCSGNALACNN